MRHAGLYFVYSLALPLSVAMAQKVPVAPGSAGTVTGHVMCIDTQRPARFAEVQLLRRPDPGELDKLERLGKAPGSEEKAPTRIVMLNGRTGMDGSFSIGQVPLGDYYVVGVLAGYVFPVARVADKNEAADLDKVLGGVPLVHVLADKTAEANLRLERGGLIGGRVQFEDGAPVVGMFMSLSPVEGVDGAGYTKFGPLMNLMGQTSIKTDEEGRFHAAGLRPGKYLVSAGIDIGPSQRAVSMGNGATSYQGSSGPRPITIYYPATLRKSEAKAVEVGSGEARSDLIVEVALSGLHSVQGRVLAREDQHAVNHGTVTLRDNADKDFSRRAQVEADGRWRIDYMPSGTFALTVSGVEDVDDPNPMTFQTKVTALKHYGEAKVEVIVAAHDVVVEDLLVGEVKTAEGAKAPR